MGSGPCETYRAKAAKADDEGPPLERSGERRLESGTRSGRCVHVDPRILDSAGAPLRAMLVSRGGGDFEPIRKGR
jgi:hypothetical protein